ncbi:Kinesin- motor protein [Coemansia sp. Benny D160-2]|nr:Kinesin- motor protein [Coemansia sp. Benny D160-2]
MSKASGRLSILDKEKDTNIQVVVRDAPVRQGRTNTSVVVPPMYGQDVKIDGPPSVARTYHFDGVFGPKATQENVYEKIVSPILGEVMQGYNCTIFAYGQTGTGKTYTMEGDLDTAGAGRHHPSSGDTPQVSRIPTPASSSSATSSPPRTTLGSNGNNSSLGTDLLSSSRISSRAGIIPRTLSNMFYALEKNSAEYYVRVSYLELYNEELRDLLAGVDITGSDGPKFNYDIPTGHLKVYESGTDKGVVIQGLEERIVSNARDAIALMQAGAMRRKVAATKCNDSSSRSHAIFTITVFVRERAVTVEGEDIVKLGKLNLVDLAGSENIGRSGAQGVRAQEAGNINKSLLVLGRVINALVERNSYVPYRDSKLTYILKDSLGGRTRTCMVATMSTAPDNIEETIKTLQYASQAKGIRNRPVANKKVSKSEIVHDMQLQIEQLRKDLDAARDGAGFFITRDTYDELTAGAKASRDVVDEWKQRVALWEEEMVRINQRCADLAQANSALENKCEDSEANARAAAAEAERLQLELRQSHVLANAHALHERRLDGTAAQLRQTLADAAADVRGWQSKVDRMTERERLNLAAVADIGRAAASESARAAALAAEYDSSVAAHADALAAALEERVGDQFGTAVQQHVASHAQTLRAEVGDLVAAASSGSAESSESAKRAAAAVDALLREFEVSARQTLAPACAEACTQLAQSVARISAQQREEVAQSVALINASVATAVGAAKETLATSGDCVRDAVAWMEREILAQVARATAYETKIAEQVEGAAREARALDDQLVALVARSVEERRKHEAAVFGRVVQDAGEQAAAQRALCAEAERQVVGKLRETADASSESLTATLAGASETITAHLHSSETAAEQSAAAADHAVSTHTAVVSNAVESFMQGPVRVLGESAHATLSQSVKEIGSIAMQTNEQLSNGAGRIVGCAAGMQGSVDDALLTLRQTREHVAKSSLAHGQQRAEMSARVGASVSAIAEAAEREASSGVCASASGGSTPPRERSYFEKPGGWSVTRAHGYILAKLADSPALLDDCDLEWTGEPAADHSTRDLPLISPAATAAASPADDDGQAMVVEPPTPRLLKRSSDCAGPASVEAGERPAQRPCTRTDSDSNVSSAHAELPILDGAESAIPAPPSLSANGAASRLPAPRRSTRRARV